MAKCLWGSTPAMELLPYPNHTTWYTNCCFPPSTKALILKKSLLFKEHSEQKLCINCIGYSVRV